MHTKSTFGTATRDAVATAYLEHLMNEPQSVILEMLRDGFDGLRNMKDEEVFRIAMMTGYFDEDARK